MPHNGELQDVLYKILRPVRHRHPTRFEPVELNDRELKMCYDAILSSDYMVDYLYDQTCPMQTDESA